MSHSASQKTASPNVDTSSVVLVVQYSLIFYTIRMIAYSNTHSVLYSLHHITSYNIIDEVIHHSTAQYITAQYKTQDLKTSQPFHCTAVTQHNTT